METVLKEFSRAKRGLGGPRGVNVNCSRMRVHDIRRRLRSGRRTAQGLRFYAYWNFEKKWDNRGLGSE